MRKTGVRKAGVRREEEWRWGEVVRRGGKEGKMDRSRINK
jgi:hypothetical protein